MCAKSFAIPSANCRGMADAVEAMPNQIETQGPAQQSLGKCAVGELHGRRVDPEGTPTISENRLGE